MPEPAMVVERLAGPRGDQNLLRLLQALLRLVMVDAEALVIVDVVRGAAAETDDEPPFGDVVEERQLLCEADRMMQRRLHDREPDLAASRRSGQRTGKADRVDIGADPVEVVLGEPDHIHAELVRQPSLAQRLVDHRAVARRVAAVRKQEIAEFHAGIAPTLGASQGGLSRVSSDAARACHKSINMHTCRE